MKRHFRMLTRHQKAAVLLSAAAAVAAVGCIIYIITYAFITSSSSGHTAEIYQDGALIREIPLDNVTDSYTFTVTGSNGGVNVVEVRPGSIGIISADCPDKVCVNQGFIHSPLLPITCLPNRLVIRIRDGQNKSGDEAPPDGVAY